MGRIANSLIGGLGGLVDPTSSFGKGFFGGATGLKQGSNAAQAKAIYGPIVDALRSQTQQLITKQLNPSEQGQNVPVPANYKDFTSAQSQFRQLFNQKDGFTIKSATAQLSKMGLAQQGMVLNNAPGMTNRISRGFDNYLRQFNFSEQGYKAGIEVKNNMLKGMRQGKVSASEFDQILNPIQLARRVGGPLGKEMAMETGANLKKYLGSSRS